MENKRFRKGDLVWFVDIGQEGAFPECADFETRTTDGQIVMNAYFGLLTLPKECCYHSKEECQEAMNKEMEEVAMMKQIDFQLVSEIQKLSIELFEAQDEDYPDGRVVKGKEKAIWNRLAKITSDKKEQGEILDAINHGNWRTDDLTYKPICDELRNLGYEII